jgi:hypothetical protein
LEIGAAPADWQIVLISTGCIVKRRRFARQRGSSNGGDNALGSGYRIEPIP